MKNFVILKFPSTKNKGDRALAKCLLEGLTKLYPTSKISILCKDPIGDKTFFSRYGDVHGGLFLIRNGTLHRLFFVIQFIFRFFSYLIWIKFRQFPIDNHGKTILTLFERSDLIIFRLSNFFRGSSDVLGLILQAVIPIYLAKKLGKKIYVPGITIDPPRSFFFRILARFALNRVNLITTRESLSIDVLKSLKVKVPISLTADLAFLLGNEPKELGHNLLTKVGVPKNNKIRIGINVRGWSSGFMTDLMSSIPRHKIRKYHNTMVTAIEMILLRIDAIIVLFPTDLYPINNELLIAASTKSKVRRGLADRVFVIDQDYEPEQIKAMMGTMDAFIGFRFHSTLFAISMCVPTISISYMNKNRGLMEMMGLSDWFLNFSDFTAEQLVDKTLKLLKQRQNVINIIKDKLPDLQNYAMRNMQFIQKLLDNDSNLNQERDYTIV